jgi:spore coat protein H
MDHIGIFPLKNRFTELMINGQTQGTYLMIQKPEDYCRAIGSGLLVRRNSSQQFKIEFIANTESKKSTRYLRKISELTKHYSGVLLHDTLAQIVDLNAYDKWLAFNYLIMNGDYTDELFLFLAPETGRYRIIPWDYDDIFAEQPHEGQQRRDQKFGNQLLFSSEAPFDLMIAGDEYLYQEYLKTFHQMLSAITPEVLKNAFERVYNELYPYFSDPEIIAQSQYDQSGLTNIELLREDLKLHYDFLLNRRNSIEATLVMTIDH